MTKSFRVNYIRDGLIEEFHEGVMEIRKLGDSTDFSGKQPYYIRSCAKPLQASLLIDYGMDFTQKELAFCSGSHAGEIYHIETALKIMQKLGIDESYLKCGIHPPLSRAMQDRMLLEGKEPSVIQNNCSGKHLGFLAICLKNGWDTETYFEPEHPLQIEVKKKIYELCKLNMPCNQFTTSDNNSDGYEDSVKEEDVSAFHTEADEEEIIGITTAAYRAKDDDENVNIKKIENYVDKAEGSNVSVPMHESINDEERNGTTRVHNDYTGDNADALTYPVTTDGCGVPIVSMPLGNLLIGYENLIKRYPRLINAIIEKSLYIWRRKQVRYGNSS